MIDVKNDNEILIIEKASKIAAGALKVAGSVVAEGVTTKKIDTVIHDYIKSCGATPSFLGYGGFPASSCISINNQVIHGIPSNKVFLKNGDIVSIDVGAYYNGFHGDNAYTFTVGEVLPEHKKLLEVTKECLYRGIKQCRPNNRIGDISYAVQSYAEQFGYGVVRKYVGHGIGKNLHESPEVPNFGTKGKGPRLIAGMTICIEPMINLVGEDVKLLSDKWTIVTASGSVSAHFEHNIVITTDGCKILTEI